MTLVAYKKEDYGKNEDFKYSQVKLTVEKKFLGSKTTF